MYVERNAKGQKVGQAHHWSRWTDAEVRWVRELHEGGMSYRAISRKLEMPISTVAAICRDEMRTQTYLRTEE